ncbi:MAG TPA: hypothetical protein VGK44_16755, partial [Casimicrobiaceae bacterium]
MVESRVVRFHRLFPSIVRRMALACFAIVSSTALAAVPNPTVTGPVASPVAPGDPTHNYVF